MNKKYTYIVKPKLKTYCAVIGHDKITIHDVNAIAGRGQAEELAKLQRERVNDFYEIK